MGQDRAATDARHHLSQACPEESPTTAVIVLYGTERLDLTWIPEPVPVILVANDTTFDWTTCTRPGLIRIDSGANIGFGAAVNAALPHIRGERVVLVNPDTDLGPQHWSALVEASANEIVTVPLAELDGTPTTVVRRHYTPLTLTLTAWRIGRVVPRFLRRRPTNSATSLAVSVSAREAWASGACVSLPLDRLRSLGGFDDGYFLYFEDADLGRRMGRRFPDCVVRLADVAPGTHRVGGTATTGDDRRMTRLAHARSAARYASAERSLAWGCARFAAAMRVRLVNRTVGN